MSGIKVTPKDRALSEWVRYLRDDGVCQRCGSSPRPGGLHAAHMFGRACKKCTTPKPKPHDCTRLDPDNLLSLCYGCHSEMDQHPEAKAALFRSVIGDERFDALAARAHGRRDRVK